MVGISGYFTSDGRCFPLRLCLCLRFDRLISPRHRFAFSGGDCVCDRACDFSPIDSLAVIVEDIIVK